VKNYLKKILLKWCADSARTRRLYIWACGGNGLEWAQYLKQKGVVFRVGNDCYVSPRAVLTDPGYLAIGNNVRLSDCTILGHDGSVNMINKALGTTLDSVGRVQIFDNVFIGYGAIVCPGVRIGPNAIVGAGAVVVRDVKEGEVVLGSPAKVVNRFNMTVEMLQAKNESWPWYHLIQQRKGEFSAALEPQLVAMRQAHFFPDEKPDQGLMP